MDPRSVSAMSDMDDMVTVSLSEVLAARNHFLEEREFWALCRECCLTLEYVHDCHDLFQSLCISPDTVAFDPEGNVCFLDLDMEPEPLYVAPELGESGNSFKSHLFSLGMTLLFATEYNSESQDPNAELSENLTDLLGSLTSDESDLRPDLDSVIDICDKALEGELSQIICLNIVGLKERETPILQENKPNSSLFQVTDELTTYLESQSGLVQTPTGLADDSKQQHNRTNDANKKNAKETSKRDHNDNCVVKGKLSALPPSIRDIIKEASPDEEEMMACQDDTHPTPPRRTRKRHGIMLGDLLRSLNRYLGENELWALCRECVVCLQRKKKHLPAYISPETVMICESGTIAFKAIPEEKPLEVVYMAPELQQKGTVDERTCLYGLGITLRKAAGVKLNSSNLSITDGEALEILINSFLQTNADHRPSLDTAYEMCEEYEKVNEGTSRQTCVQVYKEAFEAVISSKDSDNSSRDYSSSQKQTKDSSNSWDSSEISIDQTQLSSDTTHSIPQGDTTEAEESIDEIPSDIVEDETVVSAASAFKPLSAGVGDKTTASPSSAFKPLPMKNAPNAKGERVPSAFSSPATHFKPIILHESSIQANSSGQGSQAKSAKTDGDVVTKLRELKQNLSKKRGPVDNNSPKTGNQMSSQNTSALSGITDPSNSSDLGNYIKELRSQGQMPDTDTLASAIAKYLHREISDSQGQRTNQNMLTPKTETVNDSRASLQNTSNQTTYSQHNSPLVNNNPDTNRSSIPSFEAAAVPTHVQSSTPQTNYLPPPFLVSKAQPIIPGHTELHTGVISHAQPYQLPSSHTVSPPSMQYNVPMSSVAAHNIPQVQFTLVQDPVTGLMQMVPISYLPVQQQHLGPVPNSHMIGANAYTSSTSPNLGTQMHDIRTVIPSSQQALPIHYEPMKSHPTPKTNTDHSAQQSNSYATKATNQGKHVSSYGGDYRKDLNQKPKLPREDDNHSRSSSPSPSKDSGICLTQQSYHKDSLMDKLLNSGLSNRQKLLSKVLGIIRGEFAEDGIFDSGVEDLAIAEYILSLAALKWDTFSCAVREKYSHLIWTQEVLMILHEVITESRRPKSKSSQPIPDEQQGGYGIPYIDNSALGVSSAKKGDLQSPQQKNPHMGLNLSKGPTAQERQNGNTKNFPGTNQRYNRPRSELARSMMSSASDSTDSETDKCPRHKRRYNLDKGKSSSLHNVAHEVDFENASKHSLINKTHSPPTFMDKRPAHNLGKENPSVFSKEYFSASRGKTTKVDHNELIYHPSSANVQKNQNQDTKTQTNSYQKDMYTLDSTAILNVTKKSGTQAPQHAHKQNQPGSNYGPQFAILPSKTPHNGSSPLLFKMNNHSNSTPSISPRSKSSLSPVSDLHSKYNIMMPYNMQSRQTSSSSTTFHRHDNQPLFPNSSSRTSGPLTGDHSIHSHQMHDNHSETSQRKLEKTRGNSSSSSMLNNSKYGFNDDDQEHDSDIDFNSSAEMRRLAAEKPELYERRTPSLVTPIDRHIAGKSATPQISSSHTMSNSRDSLSSESQLKDPHKKDDKNQNLDTHVPHNNSSNTLPQRKMNKRPENLYMRSLSAVYSPDTGVKVSDMKSEFSHQRRGSDGSIDLPPVNNVLLPYAKKGQVVYHSAMIQLSLTPEVDHFIHSIDEENRAAIESQLSSLTQEINMQWRQRRKTQRFFKRLSEQSSKASKGDQNVSDQMLKDMAEMTRILAFLNLCRTHLQMLIAELNGLDVCYLHSLSVCDGQNHLILEPLMENKYLQFRTFNTKEAGSMSILQAGTPKGLLSYLYTSSALSDGYIHQFLLCFRYILTAEQMFTFVIDKCRSAQRSKLKDKNIVRIQFRSIDLLQFWIEGYFSIDFAPNTQLTKKLGEFIQEQISANMPGAQELYSLYAACRLHENSELMLMTEMEEDDENDNTYFMHMANPKQWESFRSLLKRSKSDKSLNSSGGHSRQKSTDSKATALSSGPTSSSQFSLADIEVHTLAEQLTLMEQDLFRKCHPVHFMNSQFVGVGVALSMSGLRTPSMSRKMEPSDTKRGLFVGDPAIESNVVRMISHSQELAHWVSAEILSCGSGKFQAGVIQKFISVAHMCMEVRNFATALSIFDGLDNLVVKQLPVWKNISAKCLIYMEALTEAKMKLKSEAMWLAGSKDFHIYPTVPSALFAALHLQQMEIGGFTLANGMYKWDKIRTITETVDQLRIFRDHEYGFHSDLSLQRMLQRRLNEFSDQDLHAVASTNENNFRRHSSSSSLSGTLKKFKDKIQTKRK